MLIALYNAESHVGRPGPKASEAPYTNPPSFSVRKAISSALLLSIAIPS